MFVSEADSMKPAAERSGYTNVFTTMGIPGHNLKAVGFRAFGVYRGLGLITRVYKGLGFI